MNDSATPVLSLIPLVYLLVLWWFSLSARRDEPDSASATCAVRGGHSLLSPTHSQQCTYVNFWGRTTHRAITRIKLKTFLLYTHFFLTLHNHF